MSRWAGAAVVAGAAGAGALRRLTRRYREVLADGRARTAAEVEALRRARRLRAETGRGTGVRLLRQGDLMLVLPDDAAVDASGTGEGAAAELEHLPAPDASCTALLLVDALDQAADAWAAMVELRRVLGDGGALTLVAGNAAEPPPDGGAGGLVGRLAWEVGARRHDLLPARRLAASDADGAPRIAIRHTAEELAGLAESAGFDVEMVDTVAAPGRSTDLLTAPSAGATAPRLRLRLRAARPPRPRPLLPWWPAHVDDSLPLDYLSPRLEVAERVPGSARSVLDVGCAAGALGMVLRDRGARVTGIEMDPVLARLAAQVLDVVVPGDAMEVLTLGRGLDPEGYDCVVFADCLEHLPDPWIALGAARDRLRPGGCLVVSVPNVRHWDTLASLALRGRWPIRNVGIHDRGHLRWFTRRTLLDILADCGLRAVEVSSVRRVVENRPTPLDAPAQRLPGALGELVTFQWLVRAEPLLSLPADAPQHRSS